MSGKSSRQRRRKKQAARRPVATARPAADRDVRVGWFARSGMSALCEGPSCVVTGSRLEIERYARASDDRRCHFQPTTFAEIWRGLRLGASYAFDQQAYEVFQPLAKHKGLPAEPQDFSGPSPTGFHLVHVQLFGAWLASN